MHKKTDTGSHFYTKMEVIQILQDIKDLSEEDALTELLDSVSILGWDGALKKILSMKKVKYLSMHPYKVFFSEPEKLWRTYIMDELGKRKAVRKKTKEELEDFLVDFYKSKTDPLNPDKATLATLYPEWAKYRRDYTSVKSKTITESDNTWKRFYKDTELSNVPLKDITPVMLIRFFRLLTKDRDKTHKCISNARGVLNGILSYAVEEEIIGSNPLRDVNFKSFTYKPIEDQLDNVYTKDEVEKLLDYLETLDNDPYVLGVRLFFNLLIRIGEFKALYWNDIDIENRTIYVHKQLLTERTLNDDMTFTSRTVTVSDQMKGNTSKGYRYEYLNDEALEILAKAKELNPDGEFIFMPMGKPMTTDRFNRNLKKYCESCGVKYRPSHKIRFYAASSAYTGDNLVDVSAGMGHSQVATTIHYLRNVNRSAKNQAMMFARLGRNGIKA